MTFNLSEEMDVALDGGGTLPAEWYTSEEIYSAEKKHIFRDAWQYAGHVGQVASPGDFFTAWFADIPLVIARDAGGALQAMANVCRHRGSEVVLECAGNRKTLQCHYHGWTYNLDGSLRAAPRAKDRKSV